MEPPKQADLLAGRYRLQELIGRGGMGAVWAADDEVLGRRVAIKEVVPPPGLDADQRQVLHERTLREARAAARLSDRSAVTVYDVVEADGRPWIVMERIDAPTLSEVLRRRGSLPVEEVVGIGLSVLGALEAAHASGVLHRDVKPANVMVLDDGRAVLTDFGIAVLEGDPSLTTTGMLVGSPAYMAPERARGRAATAASDLWSLGATMYAAVEGAPPFDREGQLPTLHAVVNENVPPANRAGMLAPVLSALLVKEPAERPGHARLREMLDRLPVAAVTTTPLEKQEDSYPAAGPTTGEEAGTSPAGTPPASGGEEAEGADTPPASGDQEAEEVTWRVRRPAMLALAVLVLLGGLAGGSYLVLEGQPAGRPSTPQAGKSPDNAAARSGGSNQNGAQDPPSGEGGSDRSSGYVERDGTDRTNGSSQAAPQGYRLYRDPTDFAIAVPEDWQVQREGPRVDLVDPDGGGFLRIDQTNDPAPDPLVDWRKQEESVAERLPGYERVRLERVDYRGWEAADWEFTWQGDSGQIHVLNRNVVTGPNQAYALYWSMPQRSWQENLDAFRVAARSFQPAK